MMRAPIVIFALVLAFVITSVMIPLVMIHKATRGLSFIQTLDWQTTVPELFSSYVGPQPVLSGRATEAQPLRRLVESDQVASEITRPKQPKERAAVEGPAWHRKAKEAWHLRQHVAKLEEVATAKTNEESAVAARGEPLAALPTALEEGTARLEGIVVNKTAQGEPLAALPTPGDWCVLTDGARPISESECDDVLLAPANREYKWKLQIVVPCLNREYARHHGFGFLHAQSLSLDLMQPMEMVADRKSWPVGQDRQELVRLCAPDTGLFVGTGGSGSIGSSTTGSKRGLTWCKVLLLKRSIQLLRACPVIIWVDADMLLQRHSRKTK